MADATEERFLRLENAQRETNATLLRIEGHMATSSKLFVLMHERLEHLEDGQQALVEGQQALVEGQQALVEGQQTLVEGQQAVVERLDRLVAATIRERTERADQLGRIEQRLDRLERDHDDD